MQVGGEGPEGPHRLGIAAGTDRCHVQGGADVNGGRMGMDRGNVPRRAGVLPSRHGRHLLWTRWRGGAVRKNQFPNRDRLASPLSSPQQPVGQVWYRGLAHQKPDGRSPPRLIIAPAVSPATGGTNSATVWEHTICPVFTGGIACCRRSEWP